MINALLLYFRIIVIKKRVEDAQLGVESYQTKLNLTKPMFFKDGIQYKHSYTTMSDPKGVAYLNKDKQKILIRYDDSHKFTNGTLNNVCEKLEVMLKDNVLGHGNANLDRGECTKKEIDRTKTMIKKIENILKERRQLRRLEICVGGRRKETTFVYL
ncbi:hypothetical protein Tco_0422788 [Tanacetum coccineum]